MKVYNLQQSEGLNELIGYQCDSCGLTVDGEDLPSSFIVEGNKHFCLDCQPTCIMCLNNFSIAYAQSWFVNNLCENCQDELKEKE